MSSELIAVLEVAKSLGKRKQHVFKLLKRLGIVSKLERSRSARGQKIAYITVDDFELLRRETAIGDDASCESGVQPDTGGVFYLIQLEPQHDPGRFKVGFATNIGERTRAHRTAAPYAKVLKTWPCRLLWEKTAIDCVCQGCEKLHTEVFRTDSIDEVMRRCEEFFKQMPISISE
jgi:hypothetical protein